MTFWMIFWEKQFRTFSRRKAREKIQWGIFYWCLVLRRKWFVKPIVINKETKWKCKINSRNLWNKNPKYQKINLINSAKSKMSREVYSLPRNRSKIKINRLVSRLNTKSSQKLNIIKIKRSNNHRRKLPSNQKYLKSHNRKQKKKK